MTALRYLIDTDTCIYLTKNKSERLLKQFQKLEPGEMGMSIITYGELYYGAKKSVQAKEALNRLERLTSLISVCEMSSIVSEHYGEIRLDLEKKGKIIGSNDLWIAAHALALKTTLVTNNEKEFRRVKNLTVENWL